MVIAYSQVKLQMSTSRTSLLTPHPGLAVDVDSVSLSQPPTPHCIPFPTVAISLFVLLSMNTYLHRRGCCTNVAAIPASSLLTLTAPLLVKSTALARPLPPSASISYSCQGPRFVLFLIVTIRFFVVLPATTHPTYDRHGVSLVPLRYDFI